MLRSYHCDAVAAAVAAGCCNYRSSDHYISYYCRFKIATKTVVSSAVLYYDNYCCSDYHSDRGYDNACLNAPRPQAQAYWGLSQVPFTFLLFAARKFRRPALPCFRCPPPPLCSLTPSLPLLHPLCSFTFCQCWSPASRGGRRNVKITIAICCCCYCCCHCSLLVRLLLSGGCFCKQNYNDDDDRNKKQQ